MTAPAKPADARQSNWLDVTAFGCAFALGVGAYFAIRALFGKQTQLTVTTTLLVIMCAYATLIVLLPRLRVRKDQAGDNSYYLGLLFTLSSMAFALYDFGAMTRGTTSVAGVQQIIANFGIALATTVVGILLRVMLHQMRVDPADLEAMTRIELTEAAARLRATLDTVTTDLSRVHLEIQQRSRDAGAEIVAGVMKTVLGLVKETEQAHKQVLTTTIGLTKNITEAATETLNAVERLRAVKPPALLLSTRLERAATALEQVAGKSEETSAALGTLLDASGSGAKSIADTAVNLAGLTVNMKLEHGRITDEVRKSTTALSGELQSLAKRASEVLSDLTGIERQSKRSAEECQRAQDAAVRVLTEMTSVARKLTEALNSR